MSIKPAKHQLPYYKAAKNAYLICRERGVNENSLSQYEKASPKWEKLSSPGRSYAWRNPNELATFYNFMRGIEYTDDALEFILTEILIQRYCPDDKNKPPPAPAADPFGSRSPGSSDAASQRVILEPGLESGFFDFVPLLIAGFVAVGAGTALVAEKSAEVVIGLTTAAVAFVFAIFDKDA